MQQFLAPPAAVARWLQALAVERPVQFPQPHGEQNFSFEPVVPDSTIQFERYRPTVVPPQKRLQPAREVLFEFTKGADGRFRFSSPAAAVQPVLAGVRACDLKAIAQMDAVFADPPGDPLYLKRRAATPIVAVTCIAACDARCFCAVTGSLDQRDGADLFLTPVDGGLLVEALTAAGEGLVAGAGFAPCDDGEARYREALAQRPEPFGRQLAAAVAELPGLLRERYDSPVWQRHAERCFSCGTCNLVCPTCYCFEVTDETDLDGGGGQRVRTWDACMNPGFAAVAGGHNFRAETAERQRHRVKRKFEYLPERFGLGSFCVGCGRCGRQCTTGIDIFDIVNDLVAEGRA